MPRSRKIIHIDMDAFYASVEQRDHPEWRGKPLVVARPAEERGVVAAASYEARRYGIHSAMSTYRAQQRCPQLILAPPRFAVYRAVSLQIRALMLAVTDLVEPLSLDEAYLDVSDSPHESGSATRIAERLRAEIFAATGLTASAGVSYNKMLAKIASDLNKPNGIAVIPPAQGAAFAASLPVERFHGIGKATAAHMHALGIQTGADLCRLSRETLHHEFGKQGDFYYDMARGIDLRPVEATRERKSIGSETTFARDIEDRAALYQALLAQNREAFADVQRRQLQPHTLTLKLKYSDFSQTTRRQTLSTAFTRETDAHYWIARLLNDIAPARPVRLVGITYSGMREDSPQQELPLMLDFSDKTP